MVENITVKIPQLLWRDSTLTLIITPDTQKILPEINLAMYFICGCTKDNYYVVLCSTSPP